MTAPTSPYEELVDVTLTKTTPRKLDASYFTLCLISGMIVGFFTLFSTLGVNALIAMVWSSEEENVSSRAPVIICNILWMITNSSFAVVMLGMITKFVPDEDDRSQMEYRFVVGGILGVGAGWAVVDAVLGITLTDSLPFWCALVALFACLSIANKRLADDEQEQRGEEEVALV